MIMRKVLGTSLLFLATVNAHFELYFPPTRGFDEDIEARFCGGFNTPGNRIPFPLTGGFISLISAHDTANFVTLVSFDANPANFGDFNTTESGQPIPYLKPFLKLNGAGDVCYPVDFQTLGIPNLVDGTNATIQVQYDGGDGNLYQCADITLSRSATIPSGTKCSNTSSIVGEQSGTSGTSAGTQTTGSVATASPTNGAIPLGPSLPGILTLLLAGTMLLF